MDAAKGAWADVSGVLGKLTKSTGNPALLDHFCSLLHHMYFHSSSMIDRVQARLRGLRAPPF